MIADQIAPPQRTLMGPGPSEIHPSVLAAMAQEALARGTQRVFLQVDASNAPALSLYQRLGFGQAWTYTYWRPSQP